jgi:hypothetical protein
MDPNANLREQLAIATRVSEGSARPGDLARLAELVLDMNDWLAGGGFLPANWK